MAQSAPDRARLPGLRSKNNKVRNACGRAASEVTAGGAMVGFGGTVSEHNQRTSHVYCHGPVTGP